MSLSDEWRAVNGLLWVLVWSLLIYWLLGVDSMMVLCYLQWLSYMVWVLILVVVDLMGFDCYC